MKRRQLKVENNPAPNPGPNPAPAQAVQLNANDPPQPQAPFKEDNKKMFLWLILGLLVIVVIVGGLYMFLSGQQKVAETTKPQVKQESVDSLEKDLDSVNVEEVDKEFTTVDSDLQSL